MPRYSKNKNKRLVRKKKGFQHPYQIIHFLNTASEEDMAPFRQIAKDALDGTTDLGVPMKRRSLRHIATLHPKKLVKHVVRDFQENDALGGGIGSGIGALGQVVSNLVGLPAIADAIFGVQKPQTLTFEEQAAAYFVDIAYQDVGDRPDSVLKRYERLEAYDSEYVAVFKDSRTGELTVAIRGTKLNWSDIKDDIGILAGSTSVSSQEIDGILDRIEQDFPNVKYNVAAHSLGTMFVDTQRPEHGSNFDNVFMFNPASSPAQSDDFEQLYANNPQYHYYVNQGDAISANMMQFMTQDTLENNVTFGSYVWSPIAAHSMSNWYPEAYGNADGDPVDVEQKPSVDTAEMNQDNEQSQEANLS